MLSDLVETLKEPDLEHVVSRIVAMQRSETDADVLSVVRSMGNNLNIEYFAPRSESRPDAEKTIKKAKLAPSITQTNKSNVLDFLEVNDSPKKAVSGEVRPE